MDGLLWLLWLSVIVCSIGSVLPRCENFVNGGIPETVVIPEGGGTELFCQYSDPGGIPRVVGWFRDSTMIVGDGMQEQCDCASVESGRASNLTFSNFMSERSADEYGCWATTPDGFDGCNFNVVVAEPPVIMLDQADVSGNQLGASLTISPTITLGLPLADVTWARSNQGIDEVLDRNDPRVTISSGGVLTVTNIVAGDRGEYTITASNIAAPSGVTASVQVFIEFLEIDGPTFTNTADGNFQVDCRVTGYPAPVTVTLSPDTGSSGSSSRTPAGDPFQMIREVDLTFPTCNSATTFICMATAGSSQSKNMRATPVCSTPTPTRPLQPPTNIMTQRISATEVVVSWDPPAGESNIGGYRVMYNEQERDFSTATSVTLRDLMDEVTYRITVAAFRTQNDRSEDLLFSTELFYPCDDIPLLVVTVTGTRVFLNNVNGRRTLTVNWTTDSQDGVEKYRVFVTPSGTRPPFQADTMDRGLTQYSLSPDLCDGSTYGFTVAAVDRCDRAGPMGQSVSLDCSVATADRVMFSIPGSGRTDSSIQLIVTRPGRSDVNRNQPLFVNVTNVQQINGTHTTLMYTVVDLPDEGNICLGGLMRGTFYNICVVGSLPDEGREVCRQESTMSNDVSIMPGCMMPRSIQTIDTQRMGTDGFPDWAIAVIVVAVFALLAMVFCFIGLCFACSTNNKDYDVSSVSSLQTASIPPGPSPYMTNHRNNQSSPHRSCLSYHKQGHSTNWSEHRDTLRQMDTDTGTHV